jgi:intracellular multiplication protein IcmP
MPPAQQPNQSDNSMAALWIIATVFIFGGIIWVSFKKQIIAFFLHIKLYELGLVSLFTNKLVDVQASIVTLLNGDTNKLTFEDVVNLGTAVGDIIRYPFAVLMVIMAVIIYFTSTTRVFKRTYSMRDLVLAERGNWPQITPVSNLNLIKTDIHKGPWAMALNPMQFCKRHNLLEEYKRSPTEVMSRKDWNKIEVRLKRGHANKVFAVQLGPVWPGIERVPPHIKALFAAFAARANGDAKGAAELFLSINRSALGKLNFTGAEELCKKHYNTKLVQRVVQSHAYLLTVMAEMLELARTDGVQASSDFLWLKPVDRRLWYMLNTVGRQTPFVEVAGAFSHWTAEKEMQRKLLVPMVEEATNALEGALKEIIYKPDEKD